MNEKKPPERAAEQKHEQVIKTVSDVHKQSIENKRLVDAAKVISTNSKTVF